MSFGKVFNKLLTCYSKCEFQKLTIQKRKEAEKAFSLPGLKLCHIYTYKAIRKNLNNHNIYLE